MIVLLKTLLIFILILCLLPIQIILISINSKKRFTLPKIFHKSLLKILGVNLIVRGKPAESSPLILVGNHMSYLDIIILGSIHPICFIAKEEISSWFLFGFLAKLQNSIFINRRNIKALESIKEIVKNIDERFAIVLFPEGTTGNGKKILDFRTSLFSIFEKDSILTLQNFSLCYTHVNSLPIDNRIRPLVSWYGNMNMLNHLKTLIKFQTIGAYLVIHPPMKKEGLSRKEISFLSREEVKKGFYPVK